MDNEHNNLPSVAKIPKYTSPSEALHQFLLATKQGQGVERVAEVYHSFAIEGNEVTAKKFIQAMRVSLSRWRAMLDRARQNTPADDWNDRFPMFSLIKHEVVANEDSGLVKITLIRQYIALPKLIMKNNLDLTDLFGT